MIEKLKDFQNEYMEGAYPGMEDLRRISNLIFCKMMLENKYITEKQYMRFTELSDYELESFIKRREPNTIINGYSGKKNEFFHILENGEKVMKILEMFDFDKIQAELYNDKGELLVVMKAAEEYEDPEEAEEMVCESVTTFLQNIYF